MPSLAYLNKSSYEPTKPASVIRPEKNFWDQLIAFAQQTSQTISNAVNPYVTNLGNEINKNYWQTFTRTNPVTGKIYPSTPYPGNPYSGQSTAPYVQTPNGSYNPYVQQMALNKPTPTVLPDTYFGQAQREPTQTTLPDTLKFQADSLAEHLTAIQNAPRSSGNLNSGGYGGYGYGGWGGGGGYEPQKPAWWMQLVNWNINRPEGG